jgi:hypothetical protein
MLARARGSVRPSVRREVSHRTSSPSRVRVELVDMRTENDGVSAR